ncbi:hypothetical protein [Nannocystis pusilla]|uniref:hypothetical protein n=1 Tax=Nannocystis pusilla TaxID=889268 RepID=UPI003DA1E79A
MRSAAIALVTLLSLSPVTAAAAPDDPERVVMKLDEFLKLYEKTRAEETTAPLDYALSSARYEGEVQLKDGEPYAAVFKARFRVEVLRAKGFAKVPFLPATVALESAKIGNAEAAVVIEDGHYVLVTQQRGALTLDVTFAAAVTTAEGSSGVSFQLSPAGATSAVLSVPAREDLDFTVAGAKLQSDKVVGDKRVVEAVLPSTGALEVKWQRELPKAAQQASRVLSEVYTLVSLGEGLMRATTTAQYTILFTGVDKLALKVPRDMTVLDVVGAGVREWKVDGEGNLGVQLNYAAKGAYSLRIEMEKVVRGDIKDVAAPVPVPVGVERARGFVGVESRGNLEVDAGDVKGATPVDVRALPAAILGITGQPVLLGYKYLGTDVSIPLSAWQHVDANVLVTLLDETRARTMWTREGRRLTFGEVPDPQQPAPVPAPGPAEGRRAVERVGRRAGGPAGAGGRQAGDDPAGPLAGGGRGAGGVRGGDRVRRERGAAVRQRPRAVQRDAASRRRAVHVRGLDGVRARRREGEALVDRRQPPQGPLPVEPDPGRGHELRADGHAADGRGGAEPGGPRRVARRRGDAGAGQPAAPGPRGPF